MAFSELQQKDFLNFIPENDADLGRMTNDMVKGVVTCLECEIARIRGNNVSAAKPDDKSSEYIQEEQRLNSLIKELQKTAKDILIFGIENANLISICECHMFECAANHIVCLF